MNEQQNETILQSTAYQATNKPVGQLKTNRSLLVTILLSLITFGIYALVVHCGVSNDLNIIASRYDGRRTMHYALLIFVVAPLTLGIGYLVWNHNICKRIDNELRRRNIAYTCSVSTFWLWGVLGSFILIGPFVYTHKLFKASNLLCEHYNYNG